MRSRLLLAAFSAALSACGSTLYSSEGLPPLQTGPGNTCDANTQLECGAAVCVTREVAQCEACGTPCPLVGNATPTCTSPNPATTPRSCGYSCAPGWLRCTSGCCHAVVVAAGGDHTCAVTTDQTLRCWGANGSGQVTRLTTSVAEPLPVTVFGQGAGFVLAVGFAHTCGVVSGVVQCWGANGRGQATAPALSGAVTGLAAGLAHTCAIAGGTVTCWGDNTLGQTTINLTGLSAAARIVAGANHTCTLDGGAVRCWGDNRRSQLGPGPGSPFAAGSGIATIGAGHDHTCVADSVTDGLSCWGGNAGNAVLPGLADPQPTPAVPRKAGGSGQPIVGAKPVGLIAAGRVHTCATLPAVPTELPVCFGAENGYGQLGGSTTTPPAQEPVSVGGLTPDPLVITSGTDHVCAIQSTDGELKCWGRNDFGQLGIGTTQTPINPGPVLVVGP
jgi:hypothetical protein